MLPDLSLIGVAAFLVVFAGIAVVGSFLILHIGGHSRKSLHRLRGLSARTPEPVAPPKSGKIVLPPFLKWLARAGSLRTTWTARIRTQCLQAGFFHPSAPSVFIGIKVLLIAALMVGGAAAALWFGTPGAVDASGAGLFSGSVEALVKLGEGAFFGFAVGVLAPGFWLAAQVRRRQSLLWNALPDALDMLVLCLEGGVNLNAAMQRVTDELQIAHPVLAVEMNLAHREMQLGLSAGEALRKFGDRCGLGDVRDLSQVLLQSERFGASATKALRTYVEGARVERQQKAEEKAQKAAVKILFPTLVCIFPAIFIVVLAPAAYQMAKLFAH